MVDNHSDGAYAVLRFGLDCPSAAALQLEYRLFSDLDPTHRGLIRILYPPGGVLTSILGPDQPSIKLAGSGPSRWQQFADYWQELPIR